MRGEFIDQSGFTQKAIAKPIRSETEAFAVFGAGDDWEEIYTKWDHLCGLYEVRPVSTGTIYYADYDPNPEAECFNVFKYDPPRKWENLLSSPGTNRQSFINPFLGRYLVKCQMINDVTGSGCRGPRDDLRADSET